MLIHLTLPVRQLARALRFYDQVLAVLDASRAETSAHAVGYSARRSPGSRPFLWLTANNARAGAVSTRFTLATDSIQQVQAFYAEALVQGAVSIAVPALMPQHGPQVFGCVIHDLDGHQLQVLAIGLATTTPDQSAGGESTNQTLNESLDGEAPDYPPLNNDDTYLA